MPIGIPSLRVGLVHRKILAAQVAALYSQGEQGAWYEPADFTTLFQDSAGATPVTATGQPVGLMRDKSGRGNHASQATAINRPVLQIDGNGKYYLAFNGTNSCMTTSAINFTATDKMSVFAGVRKLSNVAAHQTIIELGAATTNNEFGIFGPSNTGLDYDFRLAGLDGKTSQSYSAPITNILAASFDFAGTTPGEELAVRVNGGTVATNRTVTSSGNFITGALNLGARNGGATFPFQGSIYSLIVRGAASSEAQIANAEAYVNSKTQAYGA